MILRFLLLVGNPLKEGMNYAPEVKSETAERQAAIMGQ